MFTHPLPIQPCADPLELKARLQSLPERSMFCASRVTISWTDRIWQRLTSFSSAGLMLPASAADCAAKIPADRVRPAQGDALA